jgi:transcriptional regulator with GAF, ATPase, and Fis domain
MLLDIWRDVGRHLDLQKCVDEVVVRLKDHLPRALLLVRRLDADRSFLETVASSSIGRPVIPAPTRRRTECSARDLAELNAWGRTARVSSRRTAAPGPILDLVRPRDLDGDWIAGPLVSDQALAGVLVLAAVDGRFDDRHDAVVQQLLDPIAAAIVNDARLHDLARRGEALEADKRALLSRLERQDVTDAIVGADAGLRSVMQRVEQVAATDAPVLVIGETGAGKEVVARAVHARSRRAAGPMVRVNCGAIPPGLVDSELFGHERGSFTGAMATRLGWFERADGGTLFLDEIGELPLDAQVRLLRILQDGTFERVGGQKSLTVDVRIVAATHRDLERMVGEGRFREDLWYRIGIFPIRLPPLRERPEDIPTLAAHFAHRAGMRLGGAPLTLSATDVAALLSYPWPGNVRELAAVIERAAILGDGHRLEVAASLGVGPGRRMHGLAPISLRDADFHELSRFGSPEEFRRLPQTSSPDRSLDAVAVSHIEHALTATGGRIEGPHGAAARLKVNPHTLRARMRKLGIDWTRYRGRGGQDVRGHGAAHEQHSYSIPGENPIGYARTDGGDDLESIMRRHIEAALRVTAGRIEGPHGAAAYLGVNPHTLRARMRKLGLDWAAYRRARTR